MPTSTIKDKIKIRFTKKEIIISGFILLLFLTTFLGIKLYDVYFPNIEEKIENAIKAMAISDLAVYEFDFEIYSQANQSKSGNVGLRMLTFNTLGNDDGTKALIHGCVKVKWGVVLDKVDDDRISINDQEIVVRLPKPKMIGIPNITNIGKCRTEVVRVDPSDADQEIRSKLQNITYKKYQKLAPKWISDLKLADLVKKRLVFVITEILSPIADGRNINIVFDGKNR